MKKVLLVGASTAALLVASCSSTSSTAISAVAGDTATLITDIEADANGQPLTTTELQQVAAATSKLSTDVAALNLGTSGTTASSVLTDVTNTISQLGSFLPSILGLVAVLAPMPGTVTAPVDAKAMFDFQKLKADVATANKQAEMINHITHLAGIDKNPTEASMFSLLGLAYLQVASVQ
jgi:hypothetical protein